MKKLIKKLALVTIGVVIGRVVKTTGDHIIKKCSSDPIDFNLIVEKLSSQNLRNRNYL